MERGRRAQMTSENQKSLAKGLIAGLVGGLVGAIAMAAAERIFPRKAQEESFEGIHWGFGAAVGAAYGAIAEFYPAATSKEGATFGMALEALTQENALLEPENLEDQTTREHASELTSRVVFGVTTET